MLVTFSLENCGRAECRSGPEKSLQIRHDASEASFRGAAAVGATGREARLIGGGTGGCGFGESTCRGAGEGRRGGASEAGGGSFRRGGIGCALTSGGTHSLLLKDELDTRRGGTGGTGGGRVLVFGSFSSAVAMLGEGAFSTGFWIRLATASLYSGASMRGLSGSTGVSFPGFVVRAGNFTGSFTSAAALAVVCALVGSGGGGGFLAAGVEGGRAGRAGMGGLEETSGSESVPCCSRLSFNRASRSATLPPVVVSIVPSIWIQRESTAVNLKNTGDQARLDTV